MKVQRLTYASRRAAYTNKAQCEAEVADSTARWRIYAGKDERCELGALYCIDGHMLCKRHAGDYLVQALVKGEIVIRDK